MTATLAFLLLSYQAADEQGPSLKFSGGRFHIQVSGRKTLEPLKLPPEKPRKNFAFRKGDTWVVWDERGLTIRAGSYVRSTRLPDAATTPKLFSREEILTIRKELEAKRRSREADSLSGAVRFGNYVYLMPRWVDRSGKPWLEALFRVDLDHERPVPELLGKFDGSSLAKQKVGDQLEIIGDQIGVVTRLGTGWGLSRYDPESNVFSSTQLGEKLTGYHPINHRLGIYMEDSGYGTTMVGRVDLANSFKRVLFETRGVIKLIQGDPLLALIRRNGGAHLRNVETGAEVKIPAAAEARRTSAGVLVWSPANRPTYAVLYHPTSWMVLARM